MGDIYVGCAVNNFLDVGAAQGVQAGGSHTRLFLTPGDANVKILDSSACESLGDFYRKGERIERGAWLSLRVYRLLMRQFVNYLDHTEFVRQLNRKFVGLSQQAAFDIELQTGDCLLCYTDALIESHDPDGQMLGEEGVLRILQTMSGVEPARLIGTLCDEIRNRNPDNLSNDDVTAVLLQATPRIPGYSLGEKLNALVRFSSTFVRALDPRAERPPLPDLNLANIGGAIIPSLARRWRAAPKDKRMRS